MRAYDYLIRAIEIAVEAHDGQKDKAGRPYILHPLRVMMAVRRAGKYAQAAAVLHDVLEDTPTLQASDLAFHLPPVVVSLVLALSRIRNESLENYAWRIKQNETAVLIKLADVADNEGRLDVLSPEEQERLRRKYTKMRELLGVPAAADESRDEGVTGL